MLYNNQTLDDIPKPSEDSDLFLYIYETLPNLYQMNKYSSYLKNFEKTSGSSISYECSSFFNQLDNKIFSELKNRFNNSEEKFIKTMTFFCNCSNLMNYNNSKTIYLLLFNRIKISLEDFRNDNYNSSLKYFSNDDVRGNIMMYLIIYLYLDDSMHDNVCFSIDKLNEELDSLITITMINSFIIIGLFFILFYVIFIRRINRGIRKFVRIKKIFKVCDINE